MDLASLAFFGLIAAQFLAVVAVHNMPTSRNTSADARRSDCAVDYRARAIMAGGE